MSTRSTLVQLLGWLLFSLPVVAEEPVAVRVKGNIEDKINKTSPYSLFFDPLNNQVKVERQKVDYDLTKETVLRIGPYLLDESSVSIQMTREQGEFEELDFGLELVIRRGPIYVMSFKWPADFVNEGMIEFVDDKSQSLWRRKISSRELEEWESILKEQDNREVFDRNRFERERELKEAKSKNKIDEIKKKLLLTRPRGLSATHQGTQFGLAHRAFYEIPISQITQPFRYCLSEDTPNSRMALCSRRYQFIREAGRYRLQVVSKTMTPRVLVNDKPVTLKGTAVFLENDIPIKIAAVLKSGTYFEFVSHPKEVYLVDMIQDNENHRIDIIGYGDTPMGQIQEQFFADSVHWGFLNFMPTIGDLRKFWRASIPSDTPYIYIRGEGGVPFRQPFDFEKIPSTKARVVLSDKTTKSTYKAHVPVRGQVDPGIQLSADDADVTRLSPTEFEWEYPAPAKGVYNRSTILVHEDDRVWKAQYEIYRGYPAEISARLSGVLTDKLKLILLGEGAGQYWFENIFGWDNYTLAHQRWGFAAKYFNAFVATDPNIKRLAVGSADLKYRFTPGVWGRDPTFGMMLSAQNIDYDIKGDSAKDKRINLNVPVAGGGVFWARSMPRIFDDFFNLLPFMRYPKWVDWEFIYYPLAIRPEERADFVFAMNFHGKVQWTKNFFGEGGFGLKDYSFTAPAVVTTTKRDLQVQFAIAYGTLGLGFNF